MTRQDSSPVSRTEANIFTTKPARFLSPRLKRKDKVEEEEQKQEQEGKETEKKGRQREEGNNNIFQYLNYANVRPKWTTSWTDWHSRRGKRLRGRPNRRWQDDIAKKEGTTWSRNKSLDGQQWKALMEGYILQQMDTALVKRREGNVRLKTANVFCIVLISLELSLDTNP